MTKLNEWDTSKLDSILKRLEVLCKKEVEWGFFPDAIYPDNHSNLAAAGQRVAQVAYWNEYGSLLAPARPFFTLHIKRIFKKDGGTSNEYVKRLYQKTIQGTGHLEELDKFGNVLVKDLKDKIESYGSDAGDPNPNNSPSWAAEKGKDDPLKHTGIMEDSVEFRIRKRRKANA